jgi:hypothetical protein
VTKYDLQLIINKTTEDIEAEMEVPKNTALKAAAKIMRVWIFSYLTDLFGDVPYSGALQGLVKDGVIPSVYDTQESIYTDFFSELDEANTLLSSGVINFGAGDLIFGGDPASWRKFGNSLKLRLLNRCAGTPWSFTYDMVGTQPDVPIGAGAAAFSGADAAIAVNNEAGGHRGNLSPEDLTNLLSKELSIPVISAGGVGCKADIDKMLSYGADGVSVGSPFIASIEAGVTDDYKQACVDYGAEDIIMTERISGTPCTVINTPYVQKIGTKATWIENLLNKSKSLKKWVKMVASTLKSVMMPHIYLRLGKVYLRKQ